MHPEANREDNRHACIASRVMWYISCISGLSLKIYLIYLVACRFKTTPTITTVETNNYPIWNVQFPAVSLCNINKVYGPATKNIREKLSSQGVPDETVQKFLRQLSGLVKPRPIDTESFEAYRILETLNYTTKHIMLELMQPCDKMILACKWLGKDYPCDTIFRVTMSSEGYCCSFNQKALKFSLEIHSNRNSVSEQLNRTIARVAGYSEHVGLSVLLNVETDAYVSPILDLDGICILIHEAEDFPETSYSTEFVQTGEELAIAVVPKVVVSQPVVRTLPIAQRNCLFADEMRLRTTDRYSYQTCMTECVAETILQICHCVPFYYPHILIPNIRTTHVRQCTFRDVGCLHEHSSIFASFQPPWNLHSLNETHIRGMNCSCLPSCSEQFFRIQPTVFTRQRQSNLTIPTYEIPDRFRDNQTQFWRYAKVQVFFKDIACIKYQRDIYMSWDALTASFGGIFGLCLGGSIISLIEMGYYFSCRFAQRIYVLAMRQRRNRQRVEVAENGTECDDQPIPTPDLTKYGYFD